MINPLVKSNSTCRSKKILKKFRGKNKKEDNGKVKTAKKPKNESTQTPACYAKEPAKTVKNKMKNNPNHKMSP